MDDGYDDVDDSDDRDGGLPPLPDPAPTGMVLAKLRATDRLLGLSGGRAVEPLRIPVPGAGPAGTLALDGRPQWFMVAADPESGDGDNPWDQAHARIADQLGLDASDVLFVEPDLVHGALNPGLDGDTSLLGLDGDCPDEIGQTTDGGRKTGPGFAWHLGDDHTQLRAARRAVDFLRPRTRVAHIDTGYWPDHQTTPLRINRHLQWSFVASDGSRNSAVDPDNKLWIMDNSGHGTGTLSVLAGGLVAGHDVLGGAPEAEIIPLRIADRVVLLRTSALASALHYAADTGCAVASLSMGGWPSRAWADAVDEAYERGLCLVAAGGNRFRGTPPNSLVYPARYDRVIAVTGAMADGSPYDDLGSGTMQGSFGPRKAMGSAIAAYTPNIPWAAFGCPELTRFNGEGTSAATPQVAAAAALWIEKYKARLPNDWRRVEAVRHALFSSAHGGTGDHVQFRGNGLLRAERALAVRPDLDRQPSPRSRHKWAVWRMLTGLGIAGQSAREEMFELELAQLWMASSNGDLIELVPDPDPDDTAPLPVSGEWLEQVIEAFLAETRMSSALREHLTERVDQVVPRRVLVGGADLGDGGQDPPADGESAPPPATSPATPSTPSPASDVPTPPHRRLKVYAKDPTLASSLATSSIGEVTLTVPWERIDATADGFCGEYVEIREDRPEARPSAPAASDPAAEGRPADARRPGLLDDVRLVGQDGWPPSPGNLHFHQQMVYAVTAKTIDHFERALGRPVLWRADDGGYRQRLVVRPHALQTANAYYSPAANSLLFGSFQPKPDDDNWAAGLPIHTCLSYDIIAHETTHAILDGLYSRFTEPTNPDVLAFHEAFSDLVALLQSFDLNQLLEHEIRRSRGDLRAETLLGMLAVQFGTAVKGRDALRSAIGSVVDGQWVRSTPDPSLLKKRVTPHGRGAVLVSAVFDALIGIYQARTADLFRIASGGTGLLRDGTIDPDLTRRLAAEAAKSARQLLRMCVRALDYLPPVDITFFDFLRAIVTADYELVPDDHYNYRLAVIEAFTKRGVGRTRSDASDVGGRDIDSLSDDDLRWRTFQRERGHGAASHYESIVQALRTYAEACVYVQNRQELFDLTSRHAVEVEKAFRAACEGSPGFRRRLGLDGGDFEIDSLRRAMRARPNGGVEPEIIVSLVQERPASADQPRRIGGVTLIVNLNNTELPRYVITKSMDHAGRFAEMDGFAEANAKDPLRQLYVAPRAHDDRFAALHLPIDEG